MFFYSFLVAQQQSLQSFMIISQLQYLNLTKSFMQEHKTYFKLDGTCFLHHKYGKFSTHVSPFIEKGDPVYLSFSLKPLQILTTSDVKKVFEIAFSDSKIIARVGINNRLKKNYIGFENVLLIEKIAGKNKKIILQKPIYENKENLFSIQVSNKLLQREKCLIILGDKNAAQVFNSKLTNLQLSSSQAPLSHEITSYSYEIVDGPINQIPSNPPTDIDSLPPYESPLVSSAKMYLCHDMMGGYKEDTNPNTPNAFISQKNTYRCLNLSQTYIFNYFSHHLISIPPLHWRRLCFYSKTKCLGTFIVEGRSPSDFEYLTKDFASFLVYLCRYFHFDGYLINIEYSVSSAEKLVEWLSFLKDLLHTKVPNSELIWYDSVVYPDGSVRYQNELNSLNKPYYLVSDGIFLNYWWNVPKLQNSIKNKEENGAIFVGNDCFGRGTFGGGKYDIYKGVNAINQVSSQQLSATLFAMGFTYENGGKNDRQLWKQNEKQMYRGSKSQTVKLPHTKWNYINENQNGMKWQIEDQWAVTSFQLCKRIFQYPLKEFAQTKKGKINVTFTSTVKGTGPNFADFYNVILKVVSNGNVYYENGTGQKNTSENQQSIILNAFIDLQILSNNSYILIECYGKDAEFWGGNYGSKFKDDTLIFAVYDERADWIARQPLKAISTLPFYTFMNLGHGDNFHYRGKKLKKRYDYMSDQDFPHTHTINNPQTWEIEYGDAFLGGTSLKILENLFNLCEIDLSKFNLREKGILFVKLILKNANLNNLTFKAKEGEKIIAQKISTEQLKYGWVKSTVRINIKDSLLGRFILQTNSQNYLLGSFSIYQEENPLPSQVKIKHLALTLSEENPPVYPYVADISAEIQLNPIKRVFIGCGEEYVGFGWFDQLNSEKLLQKNIEIIGKQPRLIIKGIDSSGEFHEAFNQLIDMQDLVKKGEIILV